jgi:hypothetical protein
MCGPHWTIFLSGLLLLNNLILALSETKITHQYHPRICHGTSATDLDRCGNYHDVEEQSTKMVTLDSLEPNQ